MKNVENKMFPNIIVVSFLISPVYLCPLLKPDRMRNFSVLVCGVSFL